METAGLLLRGRLKQSSEGFTLLESLFAMAVILIGVLAVFGLFQTGLSALTTGTMRMQAALLATNLLEEMKSFGFSNLPASDTVANLAANNPGRITVFPAPFDGTVTVTSVSEDFNADGINDYADKAGNSTLKSVSLLVRAPGARFKDTTFQVRVAR